MSVETRDHVKAPWTEEQVKSLRRWQWSPNVHPYTCPNRTDSPHEEHYGDLGGLRPTQTALVCDDCGYTQTWAHSFSVSFRDSKGWR